MLALRTGENSMFRKATVAPEREPIPQLETIPQLKEEIESLKSQTATAFNVPIDKIIPLQLPDGMKQPRLYFDSHKMELLKESIAKHGVLEPILLRNSPGEQFELISGERRWRCCLALNLKSIPGIIRQMSDSMALEAAIIAHLLSEETSLIEQTESILSLLSLRLGPPPDVLKGLLYQVKNSQMRGTGQTHALSDQQIAVVNSILAEFSIKLSSFVANRLPLLNLSPAILSSVRSGKLSPTNALLINRQPDEFHDTLIAQAEGKTKGELARLIKGIVVSDKDVDKEKRITQTIYARIRSVSKGKRVC